MSGTSGTQSPPLEATGSEGILGASSIRGSQPDVVKDSEQRSEYFKDNEQSKPLGAETKKAPKEKTE